MLLAYLVIGILVVGTVFLAEIPEDVEYSRLQELVFRVAGAFALLLTVAFWPASLLLRFTRLGDWAEDQVDRLQGWIVERREEREKQGEDLPADDSVGEKAQTPDQNLN